MSDQRIAPGQNQPQKQQKQKSRARKGRSQKGQPQAKSGERGVPSAKARVVATVIAIVSVVLIAVSGYALWSQGQGVQTDQPEESQSVEQGDSAADTEQHDERDQGQSGGQGDDPNDDSSDGGSQVPQGQADRQTSDGESSAQGGSPSSGDSDDASSQGQSSQQDSSAGEGGTSDQSPRSTAGQIRVSVSVDSSAADGSVSISMNVVLPDGATAFDALSFAAQQSGVGVDARTTAYGVYVAGIGSLSEKQYGGSSGWLYAVNGGEPGVSASGYRLHDGDAVSWFYTR